MSLDALNEDIVKKEHDIYKRVLRLQKAVYAGVVLAFVLATVCLCAVAYVSWRASANLKNSVDHSNQTLACYVQDQFDRTELGLPANGYFKANPDQLAVALRSVHEQRRGAIVAWGKCSTPSKLIPKPKPKPRGGTP